MRGNISRNVNRNRFYKIVLAVLLIGIWSFPSRAADDPIGYVAGHPIYENSLLKGAEIDENEPIQSAGEKTTDSFPGKYDPRETHKVAAHVEDQGFTNTCWAFSTIAAMEGNLIKNGYADETVNLSENHQR